MTESESIKICNTIDFAASFSNPQGIPLNTTKEELTESMRMAVQALEKQISMKPKTNRIDSETTYCRCPSCNITTVLYRNCIMNYCKECGQKLDWSDE